VCDCGTDAYAYGKVYLQMLKTFTYKSKCQKRDNNFRHVCIYYTKRSPVLCPTPTFNAYSVARKIGTIFVCLNFTK